MGNINIGACKSARKCKYGKGMSGGGTFYCDFLMIEGRARTKDPNGEIINGKCGLFKPKKQEEN